MDKTIEPIVDEWKAIDVRMSIRAKDQDRDRKRKNQLAKAAKTLGWNIRDDGVAVRIETDEQENKLHQKHVREAAIPVVKENPGITKSELETFVGEKLASETDLDLRGIGLRWNEVWKSGVFDVGADGSVSIASDRAFDVANSGTPPRNPSTESPVENQPAPKKVG